jgi:hypothetical protein
MSDSSQGQKRSAKSEDGPDPKRLAVAHDLSSDVLCDALPSGRITNPSEVFFGPASHLSESSEPTGFQFQKAGSSISSTRLAAPKLSSKPLRTPQNPGKLMSELLKSLEMERDLPGDTPVTPTFSFASGQSRPDTLHAKFPAPKLLSKPLRTPKSGVISSELMRLLEAPDGQSEATEASPPGPQVFPLLDSRSERRSAFGLASETVQPRSNVQLPKPGPFKRQTKRVAAPLLAPQTTASPLPSHNNARTLVTPAFTRPFQIPLSTTPVARPKHSAPTPQDVKRKETRLKKLPLPKPFALPPTRSLVLAGLHARDFKFTSLNGQPHIGFGFAEARQVLLDRGFKASFLSEAWVENHYRWIVWKLAALETAYPDTHFDYCSAETVLDQLTRRYEVEYEQAKRSVLHQIFERDMSPEIPLTLFVASVTEDCLELSDGW